MFNGYLCASCKEKINKINGLICNNCGLPILEKNDSSAILKDRNKEDDDKINNVYLCSYCKNMNFNFYKLRSYGIYEGVLKRVITLFKYDKIYSLADDCVGFFKQAFDEYYYNEKIDFIETVPDYLEENEPSNSYQCNIIFYNNFSEANHMQIIAYKLSNLTRIPYSNSILKVLKTCKQQKLNKSERIINLVNAFKVRNPFIFHNKNILLIDDVWTTGSTLCEISKVLKYNGANKIYLLTLARGL